MTLRMRPAPLLVFLMATAFGACTANNDASHEGPRTHTDITGRFAASEVDVGVLSIDHDDANAALVYQPLFWRSRQPLRAVGTDSFEVVGRPQRTVTLRRNEVDDAGRADAIVVTNIGRDGIYRRLDAGELVFAELAKAGDVGLAMERARAKNVAADAAADVLAELVYSWPATSARTYMLADALTNMYPQSAELHALRGELAIRANEREAAKSSFDAAVRLDPTNEHALRSLGRLGFREPAATIWSVPFDLGELFQPPSETEITYVAAVWEKRNLRARDINVVHEAQLDFSGNRFDAQVVSHRVHGQLHYGTILTPSESSTDCCAVVVHARGVSWDYDPITIRGGLRASDIVGPQRNDVIYVVPSFRGETMVIDDREYTSEGDPTDSWDGATDDLLALLNITLSVRDEADPQRICVVGGSRGGSVALLAGIRDSRIKCVVAIAAPVDWFSTMSEPGWTMAEVIAYALHAGATPDQSGGQFIRRYLRKAIEGREDAASIRRRMIAGSPLYFSDRLPPTRAYYGDQDLIVPRINGVALERTGVVTQFFATEGHDVNAANAAARAFVSKYLELH